ncbi:MAG: TetR/AcrR family transcriptional regulator, partial [Jatrophihabitantaceae bacterium]
MNNSVSTVTDGDGPDGDGPAPAQIPTTRSGRPDGRSSRWSAHRSARRDELIDAAIAAIGEYGAAAGMDQIAAKAGTSKPVVYRYFADKSELYRAVSTRLVERVLRTLHAAAASEPPPRALIRVSIDAYLGLLEQSPELYRFVAEHPVIDAGDGRGQTSFSAVVADLLGAQLGAQLREGDLDPAFAHPWGEGIVGFINSAGLWWLDHRDVMTRAQLTAYLGALLWGGAAGVYQYVG